MKYENIDDWLSRHKLSFLFMEICWLYIVSTVVNDQQDFNDRRGQNVEVQSQKSENLKVLHLH